MRYSAGTSLADLERGVLEATDNFNAADVNFRAAEQARAEARANLEKAQHALDEAYCELRNRAPGGTWGADRHTSPRSVGYSRQGIAGAEGFKAVARSLAAE